MKVKSVSIKEFRRFTDLNIFELPITAKLVVMLGPNGSGKTALFDAFNVWASKMDPNRGLNLESGYHAKVGSGINDLNLAELAQKITIELNVKPNDLTAIDRQKLFYFRSAYRNEADFHLTSISIERPPIIDDYMRPHKMILPEARVSDNYRDIVAKAVEELFDEKSSANVTEIREKVIGKIRNAMNNIFEDLILDGTGNPQIDRTFLFTKGSIKRFQYQNLSGGEKATFDLLLDFALKVDIFNDTIFCIDEPELHTNTRLQSKLMDELYNMMPDACQLWIATHSIGMVRRAIELQRVHPQEVIFLDFEGHDFDQSVTLRPVEVDRQLWKRVFHVALDDLADLVAPSQIVFCEGRPPQIKGKKKAFDSAIYKVVFSSTHPDTEFISLGGTELRDAAALLAGVLRNITATVKTWEIIDRDDRSDIRVQELQQEGVRVLSRRDIENYLWDDEILKKLCNTTGQSEKADEIIEIKQKLLEKSFSDGNIADDIKQISRDLYLQIKRTLKLTRYGNDTEDFCIATLAPLITPDTTVYKELETDVFGT